MPKLAKPAKATKPAKPVRTILIPNDPEFETKHPRHAKGSRQGGRFAPKPKVPAQREERQADEVMYGDVIHVGRLIEYGIDPSVMWSHHASGAYGTVYDQARYAIREMFQNARDACVRRRDYGPGERPQITYRVDANAPRDRYEVTFTDNGVGMDPDTLVNKFLVLGSTGKPTGESVGGFGVAKAVILSSCDPANGGKWEIETNGIRLDSDMIGKVDYVEKVDFRRGTSIRLKNVADTVTVGTTVTHGAGPAFDFGLKGGPGLSFIQCSDFGDIEVIAEADGDRFNISPLQVKGRRPALTKTSKSGSNKARIYVISREKENERRIVAGEPVIREFADYGGLVVRIGGLAQIVQQRYTLEDEIIVVDIDTNNRPGSSDYPLDPHRLAISDSDIESAIESVIDDIIRKKEQKRLAEQVSSTVHSPPMEQVSSRTLNPSSRWSFDRAPEAMLDAIERIYPIAALVSAIAQCGEERDFLDHYARVGRMRRIREQKLLQRGRNYRLPKGWVEEVRAALFAGPVGEGIDIQKLAPLGTRAIEAIERYLREGAISPAEALDIADFAIELCRAVEVESVSGNKPRKITLDQLAGLLIAQYYSRAAETRLRHEKYYGESGYGKGWLTGRVRGSVTPDIRGSIKTREIDDRSTLTLDLSHIEEHMRDGALLENYLFHMCVHEFAHYTEPDHNTSFTSMEGTIALLLGDVRRDLMTDCDRLWDTFHEAQKQGRSVAKKLAKGETGLELRPASKRRRRVRKSVDAARSPLPGLLRKLLRLGRGFPAPVRQYLKGIAELIIIELTAHSELFPDEPHELASGYMRLLSRHLTGKNVRSELNLLRQVGLIAQAMLESAVRREA